MILCYIMLYCCYGERVYNYKLHYKKNICYFAAMVSGFTITHLLRLYIVDISHVLPILVYVISYYIIVYCISICYVMLYYSI